MDEVLNELERLQTQKADLEKKEQELKATLRKKLEAQNERLKKLGVAPKEEKCAESNRVGQIVIVGFLEKDEEKVKRALGLVPGTILQPSALEEARANIEKAGFRGAKVDVLSNELDICFKDVRVRSAAELDR